MGVKPFGDLFSGEPGIAALAHLEHFSLQVFGPERDRFVPHDLPADAHRPTL